MNTALVGQQNITPASLRPFDIQRDLLAVADLVELCFRDNLDEDGRLYIRQMRRTADNQSLLRLAAGSNEMPLGGFVWAENDQVVGNLSLISIRAEGQRRYLIANVAVHPEHRRRGIARQLTEAALGEVHKRGGDDIWLQADADNQAALQLYASMGFVEMARRTTWVTKPTTNRAVELDSGIEVQRLRARDRDKLQPWMEEIYPADVRWNLPLDFGQMRPGVSGTLKRLFGNHVIEQWGAYAGRQLQAALVWQSSSLNADRLWLCGPQERRAAAAALLSHAQRNFKPERQLILNYPAGAMGDLIEEYGFTARRTLVWMCFNE